MADRSFTIEIELATRGVHLKIPKFTKGKKQIAAKDVEFSRQISNVRIHVERVIGRLRNLQFYNQRSLYHKSTFLIIS